MLTRREDAAEAYLRAAREHLVAMSDLMRLERYVLGYYVAGLTVECVFRAYVEASGAQHDEKHDLRRLADAAHFFDDLPQEQEEQARAALADVYLRWLNNHRYRSEADLRRFLNEQGLYRRRGQSTNRGDVIKANSAVIARSATVLLTLGVARWQNFKAKWNNS